MFGAVGENCYFQSNILPAEPFLVYLHEMCIRDRFLGRLVPEKGIRYLVEAFTNVKTDKKLVIAGGSSDTDSFMEECSNYYSCFDNFYCSLYYA